MSNDKNGKNDYMRIIRHYERCLGEHGAGARAVDWNSPESALARYEVMHGLFAHESEPVSVLDFGCGLGDFQKYLRAKGSANVRYEGLDISPEFAAQTRRLLPGVKIHCMDVLKDDSALPEFDYVVMNGIFTRRETLSEPEMFKYLQQLTKCLFSHARRAIAFNVMPSSVDWKSDELFYPSMDALAEIICTALSRDFVVRSDYGLYECTWYVYRRSSKS